MRLKRSPGRRLFSMVFPATLAASLAAWPGGAAALGANEAPGARIAVAEADLHQVEFFSAAGSRIGRAPTGVGPRGMAFRGDELFVANAGVERAPGSTLTVIHLPTLTADRTVFLCEACGPYGLTVDPAGVLWVAVQAPPAVIETPPPYRRRGRTFPLSDDAPGEIAATDGGAMIAAALRGAGSVAVLDGPERRARRVSVGGAPERIVARPGAAEVWTITGAEGALAVIRRGPDGEPQVNRLSGPAFAQDLDFSPDGSRVIVSGARDRTLSILDPRDGRAIGRVVFSSPPEDLAVSPDGRRAAVFLPAEERVAVVRLAPETTPAEESSFSIESGVVELLWIP